MSGLKLVSVNIERSKHLDLVERFLAKEPSDVVCIQELSDRDIPRIETILGTSCVYAPMIRIPADEPDQGFQISGVGIFSKHPVSRSNFQYYIGNENAARTYEDRTTGRNRVLLMCDLEFGGETYRILTTHFTWTPKGDVSDEQRQDLKGLLSLLEQMGDFVLCGDFNAPRIFEGKPGEIFSAIAKKYKDNIPAHYETSLNLDLHRAGKLRPHELIDKMVDGLFTTPGYVASNVVLHPRVSDHCAIVAEITR